MNDKPTPRTDAHRKPYQDSVYGFFTGGDPRNFHPDEESCSPKEIESHRAACRLWDEAEARGETPTPEACPSGWNDDHTVHVLCAPYGIGVQSYEVVPDDVPATFAQELEMECDALKAAIESALEYASGRWSEWGQRAEGVRDILENALAARKERP